MGVRGGKKGQPAAENASAEAFVGELLGGTIRPDTPHSVTSTKALILIYTRRFDKANRP
jgi:hypothetical protein